MAMDKETPKVRRICPNRQPVGNICLSLQFGLSCSLVAGDNICMIEAEARKPEFLSADTKRRMRQAKRIDTEGKACVILKA